jgi:hypothetical protein
MKHHLTALGFCRTYEHWTYHGERLIPQHVAEDNDALGNNMVAAIEDLMEEDTDLNEENSGT